MMSTDQQSSSIPATAFVSTYVPRRCGIATFAWNLVNGLRAREGPVPRTTVVALDRRDGLAYPAEVGHLLPTADRAAYRTVARLVSRDGSEVVSLQHEYGIYGGRSGAYVLDLLDAMTIPVVSTLHTILARPTRTQESILRAIADRSARVVTMTERGREILVERYAVDQGRIVVIPHGVPDIAIDRRAAKAALGLDGGPLVLSFGLLGPHKNVEQVLEALARVVDRAPDTVYAVVGATHPDIRRRFGEQYRETLHALARELGLDGRVRFVDRYLTEDEVAHWLAASDVFVTPYRNAQQIASGTLAYAMAAGSAVISTPYAHAVELLGEDRGLLVPFDDVDGLGRALELVLTDETAREAIGRRGRALGRTMTWPAVAERYGAVFRDVAPVASRRLTAPAAAVVPGDVRPAPVIRPRPDIRPARPLVLPARQLATGDLPVARLHLDELRDRVGVAQFAVGRTPDLRHGYCTDDMARALLVDLRHAAVEPGAAADRAVRQDLAFLAAAFDASRGRFRNFRTASGEWTEQVGSQDAHGRAIQALGEAVVRSDDPMVVAESRRLLWAALPATLGFEWARPRAYAILGCAAALDDRASARLVHRTLADLVERLERPVARARAADAGWPWPEPEVTYDNGVIAEALIVGGGRVDRRVAVSLGLGTLEWLFGASSAPAGHLRPVGNQGWWPRGGRPARWDQQPIEPASLVAAAAAARAITGEARWAAMAERAFAWFLGANDLGLRIADPARGACRDGLRHDGVNVNEGAESTLAWLLAVERIRDLRQDRSSDLRRLGLGQERTYASTSAS